MAQVSRPVFLSYVAPHARDARRIHEALARGESRAPARPRPSAGPGPRQRVPRAAASGRAQPALLLIAAVIAAAAVYIAIDRFVLSKRPAATPTLAATDQAGAPGSITIPKRAIAVLPFADLSEKKAQEHLSDGLSEELLNLLALVPDLRVPGRTSSFSFKGKSDDIAAIARKLRVAHVLEGSVRRSGDALQVTAQLIRVDNGEHLWSNTYDREVKDIFKIEDEIAAAVVAALKLGRPPTRQASSHHTASMDAYDQYLLGQQFYNRSNLDSGRRAIEAYRKAIALDPNYAVAYAGLAAAESYVADLTGETAALLRAEEAADKAVTLEPGEADGYAARGYLRYAFAWDWTRAQEDFAKAMALAPGDVNVQVSYGYLLASLGRAPEAIALYRRITELDPLSNVAWERLGRCLTLGGDFAAADQALRRALEIKPDSAYGLNNLARLQLLEGKAAEALATYRKIADDGFRLSGLAMAEHTLGHAQESRQVLDEAIAKTAQDSAYQIAEAFAWRGDKDDAFEWLERAYQQRDGGLSDIKVGAMITRLRADPRYQALLRRMDLQE